MLDHRLADIDAYVAFLSGSNLPVLRHTRRQLDTVCADLERVSGKDISGIVLRDPLLAVKVLYYIQPFRGKALRSEITTIGGAIMMLGIEPFVRKFEDLPTIEDRLSDHPEAVLGAVKLIRRVQRAAHYAHDWAIWRHDLNIEEVTIAALLHDLAEILIWCFAPTLALDMQRRQHADRSLRSATVQQEVLGVELRDLQVALCRAWHLPELLQMLMDDAHAEQHRVQNVSLAVNLARHSANGWDDAALPDDYRQIGELLGLTPEAVMKRVGAPIPAEPDPTEP
jgi:HD-like signal output (HDOD) protein